MKHLIDKDAVLGIIEQLKDEAIDMNDRARWFLSAALTRRIEALEVKEVGLEKESLTWKDIGTIDQLLWDLSDEYREKSDSEEYYKAVLNRFKAQKGK